MSKEPERLPGETWMEWRARVRQEELRRLLPEGQTFMEGPTHYAFPDLRNLPSVPKPKAMAGWVFFTPDDGAQVVLKQRYTSMQPQDGSRATLAAMELIASHQNRSHG